MCRDARPPEFDLAVVIPCSKRKAGLHEGVATFEELRDRQAAHARLAADVQPARALYRGRQHESMVRAVDAFRLKRPDLPTGLFIASAGYGLLDEWDEVVPYEAALGTTHADWLSRGAILGLPMQIDGLAGRARVVVFALSAAYLTASRLPSVPHRDAVYLAGSHFAARFPDYHFMLAGRAQARGLRKSERDVRASLLTALLEAIAHNGLAVIESVRRGTWKPVAGTRQLELLIP